MKGVLDPILIKYVLFYDFVIITIGNCLKLLSNKLRWLLPPNENYFLPITAIKNWFKMPSTSKKRLFVAIADTESHYWKNFSYRVCSQRWWQEFRSFSDKILFDNYHIDSFFHKSRLNWERSQFITAAIKSYFAMYCNHRCVERLAISKLLTFVAESSVLDIC